MKINSLEDLKQEAAKIGPKRISVVNPAEDDIFEALKLAYDEKIIYGYLTGNPEIIEKLCEKHGLPSNHFEIIDARSEESAAKTAIQLIHSGDADFLMKGTVSTSTFLKAVLDSKTGLRKPDCLLSHVAIHDVPGYPRLILLTDAAFNIKPDVEEKAKLIDNAVKVASVIGLDKPRVACVSAVEKVNPKIESTVDAAKLAEMGNQGRFPTAIVQGPFGFDNAVDEHSARVKGIHGEVAGKADIILAPDMVAGNMIYKTLTTMAKSVVGAVVVGTTAPVILTSRADNEQTKLLSLALGALDSHHSY